MANIMVNEACNLRCPYCFAEEFVNHNTKEMSLEDFKEALNFVLGDGSEKQVGIIGGEPLVYKYINEALYLALDDTRAENVMIYTNAIELDRLSPEILDNPRFRMLVNCNSPEDMGESAHEKMAENLLRFRYEHQGNGRFRLSVNLYKPDFDYTYVLPFVQEFEFDVVRLSVSVPQKGDLKGKSPLEYFLSMKPLVMRFIGDMIRNGVLTGFDCNFIPECVFTKEEQEGLRNAKDVFYEAISKRFTETFWDRVIYCEMNNCTPVIDILPDLQAIRCFGLSEYTKRSIRDFSGIGELSRHYFNTVDMPACEVWSSDICKECYSRDIGACSGGCLLFKAEKLFA